MKLIKAVSILFLMIAVSGCTGAEENGEQFPKQPPTAEETAKIKGLLEKIRTGERREKVQAAKALGDMAIAKPDMGLGAPERKTLDEIIDGYLADAGNKTDHQKSIFAKEQLERIWTFATDKLVAAVSEENISIKEAAVKQLILMHNDEICEKLIQKFHDGDEDTRFFVVFTLAKFREKREANVRERVCPEEKVTDRIVKEKVIPFLKKVQADEKSERVKKTIERALKDFEPVERG
ncbi:MAG: HEAT repeat domain-containing protein [Planctomycetota bacterium]|nr:MAG: HEAT repeat domain-containing protein [Planctomycetota bacterium]